MLVIAAFGFFLLVFRESANTFAASTITVEPGQRLLYTGPYAHVRHPMYTGEALLFFAMPIALGSCRRDRDPCADCANPRRERTLSAELPGYDDYLFFGA